MIIPVSYTSTDSQTTLQRQSFTLDRLPLVLLGKIATYLPERALTYLSTTNHAWKALSRDVWLALIQQDFPFVSKQLQPDYPEAIKTSRLCASIYKKLRTPTSYRYSLQTTIASPTLIHSAVFDSTGSRIVTATGATVSVYARQLDSDGRESWVLTGTLTHDYQYHVLSAAFDSTGSRIVTSTGTTVSVYARQLDSDGRESWVVTGTLTHDYKVLSAAFDSTGSRIVTSTGATVSVYARQLDSEGRERWVVTGTLKYSNHLVVSAAFDPTSSRIVTVSSGARTCVYTQQSDNGWVLTLTSSLHGHKHRISNASFDSTGSRIITISRNDKNDTARMYTQQSNGSWKLSMDVIGWMCNAAINPTGKLIVITGRDGITAVYAKQYSEHWEWTQAFKSHTDKVTSATFDPTSSHIITTSLDNNVNIWGLNLHKIIRRAIEAIEIQDAGICTPYKAIPPDVMIHKIAKFLTPSEQQAHRLVNRGSMLAYRNTSSR